MEISSIIISKDGEYFYIEDELEKVKDISQMPIYIKEDWINYNKKELDIKMVSNYIIEEEKLLLKPGEINLEDAENLKNLKAIKRDILLKSII